MSTPRLRKTVLRERDDARRNQILIPAFRAYRLNQRVDVSRELMVDVEAR